MPQSIIVPEDDPRGKIAVMRYRVLGRMEGVGPGLRSNLKLAARIRFVCSPHRAVMRSLATLNTVQRIHLASSSKMSGCERLRFTPGNSASTIR